MKFTLIVVSMGVVWFASDRALAAKPAAPLADAAERSDPKAVQTLLAQHSDANARQADGMTALHWAAYHDDSRMAAALVAAGANVQAANRYGVAPLSIACMNGSEPIVDLLLDAGADPNTVLRGGESALMTAARTGRIGPVQALLAHGADVDAKETNNQTALMWAAAEGHADVVRFLIKAGADFRTPLDSGFTPLLFAVREGRAEVVKALLASGADVNQTTRPKNTPPAGPSRGVSPLVMAVENGHFELAAALLEAGADPNNQRSGFTALHVITWVRKPDSGDDNGQPPPDGSGNLTSLDMVRRLVEHGADVNARLRRGESGTGKLTRRGAAPFLLAADTADVPLMRLLIELGADPTITNAEHSTPLMAAAGLGTLAPGEEAGTEDEALAAAQLALELGGDVNAVDDNGDTAMHGAAYKSLPKMVQFLADHGAKPEVWNLKNKHGWTPLLIAEGHRPGNFKPSHETIDALCRVLPELKDSDVEPPKPAIGY
jgi:ankyrin repeat protein